LPEVQNGRIPEGGIIIPELVDPAPVRITRLLEQARQGRYGEN
jgi:hypothetical protein